MALCCLIHATCDRESPWLTTPFIQLLAVTARPFQKAPEISTSRVRLARLDFPAL